MRGNYTVLNSVRILPLILFLSLVIPSFSATDLQAPEASIPATYFGMHIHRASRQTTWPNVPVPEWRLWDAYVDWPHLEPQKGQWQFETLDSYVSLAQQHGTDILLPLGLSPSWASARPQEASGYQPGFAAEPKNLDDWRTFVRTVVTRYKGRIQAYEIWNEPNLKDFWTGNTDQLLTLTKEASQIIHSVDPQAIVVSPSATGTYGTKWLADFLKKGVGQYVDVVGYHFYVNPAPPEEMVPLEQRVRQILAENGLGNKPLWNTESGWSKPKPFPSYELGAAYLARAYVLSWAAGVQRFYWYAWDDHDWVTVEATESDNKTLKPAGQAYAVVQKWLVGSRMNKCSQDLNHTWTCQLTGNGSTQWIVWNSDRPTTLTVPPSWNAKSFCFLLGVPHPLNGSSLDIGPVPVLISAMAR